VKSIAGQLGFVVVGAQELLHRETKQKPKAAATPKEKQRPNPLRGTMYERQKDEAYQALVLAKKALPPGQKLPEDAPVLTAYRQALDIYKKAHSALKVDSVSAMEATAAAVPRKAGKARTATERSPEPQRSNSLIGKVRSKVQRAIGADSAKMEEEKML
jgi:hypothetical protein